MPRELKGRTSGGSPIDIHPLWHRRQSTKFNGVSYIVQRGAEAAYSDDGKQQIRELIDFYMTNARLLRAGLVECGFNVYGGVNAPYVWLGTRDGMTSWEFFDLLLNDCHLVGTPGSGFGASGEGYFRLSAFNSRENVEAAITRLRKQFS